MKKAPMTLPLLCMGALTLLLISGCDTQPEPTPEVRVRRSWSSLSPEDRKKYIDGVMGLKRKTRLTWDYTSACEGQPGAYTKNAYDYFVELHLNAFLGMSQGSGHHHFNAYNRPHMGPHFLPWHREFLLRYEQELRDVLGDPDYVMPYWDWTAPVDQVFSTADLGDLGACPETFDGEYGQVSGYLSDQGYAASVYDARDPATGQFSVVCAPKKLTRGSGCLPMAPTLPTAADVARALEIPVYDVSPYDNLYTDEQQSFRQYLEGFTKEDIKEPVPFCQFAGCQMHGRVHVWIGGLLGSGAAPNDPLFFLHHANVDRIWAEWQDKYGDSTYPSAAPNDYTGGLYSFTDASGKPVQASSLFDHRARGYKYDTQR